MNYNKAELCKDCKKPVEKRRFNIKFLNMGGGISVANTLREVHGDYEEVAFIPRGLPSYTMGSIDWRIPERQLDPSSRRRISAFLERMTRGGAGR